MKTNSNKFIEYESSDGTPSTSTRDHEGYTPYNSHAESSNGLFTSSGETMQELRKLEIDFGWEEPIQTDTEITKENAEGYDINPGEFHNHPNPCTDLYTSTGELDEDKLYESLERARQGPFISEEEMDKLLAELEEKYAHSDYDEDDD